MEWGSELYLLAIITSTMIVGARSGGASVYYLPIPYWAGLVLGALMLHRIAQAIPRGPMVAGVMAVLFTASVGLAYIGLLGDTSGWRVLQTASQRLHDLGATVRALLSDAPVQSVTWRTLGAPDGRPPGWQYTLRGNGTRSVSWEMWPWLMEDPDSRPDVQEVLEGGVAELRADTSTYDDPGEVLLVIDGDYRLQLLAQDGQILHDGSDPG